MNLRCRVGDLAVIVGADFGTAIGALVLVERPSDDGLPEWFCKSVGSPVMCWQDNAYPVARMELDCHDQDLRPIRAADGEDQTFEWAGRAFETPAELIDAWASAAGPAA